MTAQCTLSSVRHYPKAHLTRLTAAILEIDVTSYFCRGCEIWTKSGVLMQNKMSITAMWMKSKQQGADYGNMVKIRTGSNNTNMADDCF